MPREKTEVLYDVSQAEKQLKKLDKSVVKSGKTAKKSFSGEAAGGLQKFGGTISKVSPKLGGMVSKLGGLAGSGGLIAGGFAVAGGAILATIANVVDLAGALENIDARLDVINQTAERTLKLRDAASALGDAAENRGIVEARRNLKLEKASVIRRQNEVEAARDAAKEEVFVRKAAFAEVDQAFKASVRIRQSAEQKLQDKLKERTIAGALGQFGGQPKGRQVGSLTAKAESEARKGNIDTAEALIAKAQELSGELGNHVFFTNQIEKAQGAVVRALEKDVKNAKTKEGALAQEREQLQGRVKDSEAFAVSLDKELKLILRQNRALGAATTLIKERALIAKDFQAQQEGARRVETGVRQITDITGDIGGQAFVGQLRDQFGNAFTAVVKEFGSKLGTIGEGRQSIDAILGSIGGSLSEAFEDGVLTPAEIQKIQENAAGVSDALSFLEKDLASGAISGALKQDVERILSLFRGIENLGVGGEKFVTGGGGFDTPISETGAVGTRQEREQEVVRRVSQEINVNIEGGLIDETTIEQLVDIIRREVRKEVSTGTGN